MLKITSHIRNQAMQLSLEGELTGPWVNELERAWQQVKPSGKGNFVIDLTGVTFIESDGKALLRRLWQDGAELIATGCCNRSIVHEITGKDVHG